jgi:hypothetical protein
MLCWREHALGWFKIPEKPKRLRLKNVMNPDQFYEPSVVIESWALISLKALRIPQAKRTVEVWR